MIQTIILKAHPSADCLFFGEGDFGKKNGEKVKKGGWEWKKSQGREVETEIYDKCVCSMNCSKAIDWSKLMPLTLEKERGRKKEYNNNAETKWKWKWQKLKKLEREESERKFLIFLPFYLKDAQIVYQSPWIAFLLFTSSSPSAQLLSSFHSPLISIFFSLFSLSVSLLRPSSSLCIPLLSLPSFSLPFFLTLPVLCRPIQEVCVSAYGMLVTVSLSVWQHRWIGLYLGEQNINNQWRVSALMPVSSLPLSHI